MNDIASLNVIGYVFDFLGAILLASNLLRSQEQIEDEENTEYWDGNPFKKEYNKKFAVQCKWAFNFLVIGFSFNTAVALSQMLDVLNFAVVLIFSLFISLCGLIVIDVILFIKKCKHRNLKFKLEREDFKIWVAEKAKELDDRANSAFDSKSFEDLKCMRVKNLKEKKYTDPVLKNKITGLISDLQKSSSYSTMKELISNSCK